ncbi:winged helix-turn-helix domain-containing protein [Halomarina rubra]|uniref:Winged helix-turn-helix domain-containing protein n=1 Tax=Halomarina rubra TaxID=2071873 RepID=A0ABD6AVP7_9EURY|nr:helix-turn-helix domain-containing protein [Halomarina rubra]
MDGRDSSNPFSLLANETRLGIVEAIGDASGDGEYACLSYSAIQTALGDHDAGNLNYHLRKLKARFVERTDDGYRLTVPGIRVYQAVSSGQFDGDRPTVPPTELDADCDMCDGTVVVSYERDRFIVRCDGCDVLYHRYPLSPNAFDVDDTAGLVTTAMTKSHVDSRSMLAGVCPYCSGTVERGLSADDRGDTNNDEWDVFAHLTCERCGWFVHPPVMMVAFRHPAATVFFEQRGVENPHARVEIPGPWGSTVLSTDPWRVRVDLTYEGETIRFLVDGSLDVLEWEVLEA